MILKRQHRYTERSDFRDVWILFLIVPYHHQRLIPLSINCLERIKYVLFQAASALKLADKDREACQVYLNCWENRSLEAQENGRWLGN